MAADSLGERKGTGQEVKEAMGEEGTDPPFPPWPPDEATSGPPAEDRGGVHYDLRVDDRFWAERPLVIGCVLEVPFTLRNAEENGGDEDVGHAALLVKSWKIEESGMWLEVKPLGGDKDWVWKEAVRIFSRKKFRVHLCRLQAGACSAITETGYHVEDFHLFQPGILSLDYVDRKRRKEWEGALAELGCRPSAVGAEPLPATGDTHQRISALRARLQESRPMGILKEASDPPNQSATRNPAAPGQGFIPLSQRLGPGGIGVTFPAAPAPTMGLEDSEKKREPRKRPSSSMGEILRAAVERRGQLVEKKDSSKKRKKSRGRGRSRSRRRRRRRDTTTSSSPSGSSSSSSDRLLPPLQKKAARKPGSVLSMMVEHVTEALAQAAVEESGGVQGSTTKFMTYYQILVRPQVQSKVRDQRELETLARGLDMLREGRLEELGDLLSGRFVAVENAALTGNWSSAQFLEVAPLRLPGIAQTPLLLAVQKHSRAVERASGRGSWSARKTDGWGNNYKSANEEAGNRGKGKGGKSKGKNKKGKKGAWNEKQNETGAEPPKAS